MVFAAKTVKEILRSCDRDVILVLCECLHNVLLWHVRVKVRYPQEKFING